MPSNYRRSADQALVAAAVLGLMYAWRQRRRSAIYREYGHDLLRFRLCMAGVFAAVWAILYAWLVSTKSDGTRTAEGYSIAIVAVGIVAAVVMACIASAVMNSVIKSDRQAEKPIVHPIGHFATYDECVAKANHFAGVAGISRPKLWSVSGLLFLEGSGYMLGSDIVLNQIAAGEAYQWKQRAHAIQQGEEVWIPER